MRIRIGIHALDGAQSKEAAANLADLVYRFGGSGGAGILQNAINKVDGGSQGTPDGRMGPGTLTGFNVFTADPKTERLLLEAIRENRDIAKPEEVDRNRHFEFVHHKR